MKKSKEMAMSLRKFAKGEDKLDAKYIRKLAKMVEDEKNEQAFKFMKELDTFVRDGIPEDVYQYISVNRTESKKVACFVVKLKGCNKQIGDPKVFKPGEIYKGEYVFPGDISDNELAMSLINSEPNIIKDLIEITYSEAKEES